MTLRRHNTDLDDATLRREIEDGLRAHAEALRETTGVQFGPMFDESRVGVNFLVRIAEAQAAIAAVDERSDRHRLTAALQAIVAELKRLELVPAQQLIPSQAAQPPAEIPTRRPRVKDRPRRRRPGRQVRPVFVR